MMSWKDFPSIIGSLDEFSKGVVWKELRSIGVGMTDDLGEGLFISVMSLVNFILRRLLVLTAYVIQYFNSTLLKSTVYL